MCLNGELIACGDIEHKFTLQSVSKIDRVFTYCFGDTNSVLYSRKSAYQ